MKVLGTYDVVVVGCGIGGIAAAVAAREAGASVAVLERSTREQRGGNTRYTSAFMLMKSLDEPLETMAPRLLECAMGLLDPAVVATFATESGPTIRWLSSFGVAFELVPPPHKVGAGYLAPRGGGLALVDALAASAEKGGVAFHYEATARSLLEDEYAEVSGVSCVQRGTGRCEVRARSVVLASGGFQGDTEKLARYVGPRAVYLRPYAPGGHNDRGEGIEMALAIGAAPAGEYSSYHPQAVDPRSTLVGENAMYGITYGILVDQSGRRFVDEAGGNPDLLPESVTRKARVRIESLTRRIPEQAGGVAYLILDDKVADLPNRDTIFNTDAPAIQAETLADLARTLAIPVERLDATVREFNAACSPGEFDPLRPDGLATQRLDIPKSHWARPLDRPPYAAYPIAAANVFTFGGLAIDTCARVMRSDGDPIPGLYAAGETIGMYYKDYVGATSVMRGAVFGRIAGTHAAGRRAT